MLMYHLLSIVVNLQSAIFIANLRSVKYAPGERLRPLQYAAAGLAATGDLADRRPGEAAIDGFSLVLRSGRCAAGAMARPEPDGAVSVYLNPCSTAEFACEGPKTNFEISKPGNPWPICVQ